MSYTYDVDLEFLSECSDKDLDILLNYLIKDKDGSLRWAETLTIKEEYKKYYPQHSKYWNLIAEELQCFGGNTFLNLFRNGGVCYREILIDVCNKMKVNYNSKAPISDIEMGLLMKILTDSLDNMSTEQLKGVIDSLGLNTSDYSKQAVIIAIQTAIRSGGFVSYQIAVIVANIVAKQILGRGLTLAMNASLTKAISIFAGPVGWIVTGLWTLLDIAGPAYRVTIPSVIQIAYMRLELENRNATKTKDDPYEKIRNLSKLMEEGLLTKEEFECKKSEILKAI